MSDFYEEWASETITVANTMGPRDHPEIADKARADARAVLGQETPMQEWMPGVRHVDRGGNVPVQTSGPTVIVIHTTETAGRASYAGTEPHFEIDRDGSILQYVSLARTAKALYNLPGGVETNRRRGRIIQYELVNRAGEIASITDRQLDGFAESLRWVDTQLPFQKATPPQGWFGSESASENAPSRFSFAAWEAFSGICGHQHVPENDHWDPGRFPINRLLSRLSASPASKEDLPMEFTYIAGGEDWVVSTSAGFHGRLPFGTTLDVLKDKGQLVNLGKQPGTFHAGVVALADACGFRGDRL